MTKLLGPGAIAVKFVKEHGKYQLWETLIDTGLRDAHFTGKLLEHVGTHVDPLVVIDRIPDGAACMIEGP